MAGLAGALKQEMDRVAGQLVSASERGIKKELGELKKALGRIESLLAGRSQASPAHAPLKRGRGRPPKGTTSASKTKGAVGKAKSAQSESIPPMTGAQVTAFRKRHGLKQAEMAFLCGVTLQSIYQWESKGKAVLAFRGGTDTRLRAVLAMEKAEVQERLATRTVGKRGRKAGASKSNVTKKAGKKATKKTGKKTTKKAAKKTVKKSAKKTAKKTANSAPKTTSGNVEKSMPKKATAKKSTAKKSTKKASKKVAQNPAGAASTDAPAATPTAS